jgi:type IV pilus assembly protein PilA
MKTYEVRMRWDDKQVQPPGCPFSFVGMKQQGFTLIELMIVVAIIGILAAIAIPQYQNYVARTQVAEAFNLFGTIKTAIGVYYNTEGKFPTSNIKAGAPENVSGKYVDSIETGAKGVVAITLKEEHLGVHDAIAGTSFKMTPSASGGTINWACNPNTIDIKYLPGTCEEEKHCYNVTDAGTVEVPC